MYSTLSLNAVTLTAVWLRLEENVMMHAADSLWDGLKASFPLLDNSVVDFFGGPSVDVGGKSKV